MKHNSSNYEPKFVPYDDGNLAHVAAGPDYGQPWSSSAWTELDSEEYSEYLNEVCTGILHNKVKVVSEE
jgi:hypothetical protein